MTNPLRLCNVQRGFAECYTDTHAGWVERREIRLSLDLATGKEHTARRWFPSWDDDTKRWETGYATRAEALAALEKSWDNMDRWDVEHGHE